MMENLFYCNSETVGYWPDSESLSQEGLQWDFYMNRRENMLAWNFDWRDSKFDNIERLFGTIRVNIDNKKLEEIPVELTSSDRIQRVIGENENFFPCRGINRNYTISLLLCRKPQYDEMFLPSDLNDTVLIVEGKKLHVSKHFLSYHSKYFQTLFSPNFKEGNMDEIPIEDIKYEDFGYLMSLIYPISGSPEDSQIEKLLEMADRFMIPAVTNRVEHHLIHLSNITPQKMILLADKYGMKVLLAKCIGDISSEMSIEELKSEIKDLSTETKFNIFNHLMNSRSTTTSVPSQKCYFLSQPDFFD